MILYTHPTNPPHIEQPTIATANLGPATLLKAQNHKRNLVQTHPPWNWINGSTKSNYTVKIASINDTLGGRATFATIKQFLSREFGEIVEGDVTDRIESINTTDIIQAIKLAHARVHDFTEIRMEAIKMEKKPNESRLDYFRRLENTINAADIDNMTNISLSYSR